MAPAYSASGTSCRIGCAGWALPKSFSHLFPAEGTHQQRYAAVFNAVEINSSFYRPHQRKTYERWAASVPEGFRFSVKVPKLITHTQRLRTPEPMLSSFLAECGGLGETLGPLLVQLPPKLAFDVDVAGEFFATLREQFSGDVVCEPRHGSWFESEAEETLQAWRIARVGADPSLFPTAGAPLGTPAYFRLHGSPQKYWSEYDEASLERFASALREAIAEGRSPWCIFDNTAEGFAIPNALRTRELLRKKLLGEESNDGAVSGARFVRVELAT